MEIKGFTEEGNWYKGNLHSHTVNSDGKLTPQEAVMLFREHGYHFLCFSEHDLYTDYRAEFDREDFIILPGLEASVSLIEEKDARVWRKTHHIHGMLGTKDMQNMAIKPLLKHMEPMPPVVRTGNWDGAGEAQRLVDELKARGCITTYNHPIWSRVEEHEFVDTEGVWAVEIFNYGTENESKTGYDTVHWDRMLRAGKHILAFASDDNHNHGDFDDACGGYIMVKSEELSHESIVKNMIAGNYYSSSGPEIYEWGIQNGAAYVKCSPVYRIDFIVGNVINYGGSTVCKKVEETIQKGAYTLRGHEDYIRVECTDKYGKTAWSNPIYLSK